MDFLVTMNDEWCSVSGVNFISTLLYMCVWVCVCVRGCVNVCMHACTCMRKRMCVHARKSHFNKRCGLDQAKISGG